MAKATIKELQPRISRMARIRSGALKSFLIQRQAAMGAGAEFVKAPPPFAAASNRLAA